MPETGLGTVPKTTTPPGDPGFTTGPVFPNPVATGPGSANPNPYTVQMPGSAPSAPTAPSGIYTPGVNSGGLPMNPGFPGLGEDPNAFAATGLDIYRRAADPTAISNAYQTYLRRVLSPGLLNTLTANGMGRSGAEAEAIAGAAAKMAPQVASSQQDALQKWAQAVLGVWNPMYNRYAYPPISPFDFGGGDSGGGGGGEAPGAPKGSSAPWWAAPLGTLGAAAIPGLLGLGKDAAKWLTGGGSPTNPDQPAGPDPTFQPPIQGPTGAPYNEPDYPTSPFDPDAPVGD